MSVQSQINRISGAVSNAFAAISEKGVSIPADAKSDNLAELIRSIETESNISLQEKTITPTNNTQTVTPDTNYDGLSQVVVNPIPTQYIVTTDADATSSDIVFNKTAYVNGTKVTGNLIIQHYYTGSDTPSSSLGVDGDLYLKV